MRTGAKPTEKLGEKFNVALWRCDPLQACALEMSGGIDTESSPFHGISAE